MTLLAMILSFVLLMLGGYGFSSTKVASLNIPLMQKIAPIVESWSFLNPLLCGLLLFAFAVLSASPKWAGRILQITCAILIVMTLFDIPSFYACGVAFSAGGRPTLPDLMHAESGAVGLIFLIPALIRLVRTSSSRNTVDTVA